MASRRRAEEILHEQLNQVSWALFCGDLDSQTAALETLRKLGGYLYVRGFSGMGMKPVETLVRALEDVQNGVRPEIFDPNLRDETGSLRRKRSQSSAKMEVKIYAAALLGALMKTGLGRAEAAAKVARATAKWPKIDEQEITKRTVIGWRDDCLQSMKSDPLRQDYDRRLAAMSDEPSGVKFRDFVLQNGPPLLSAPSSAEKTV